MAVLDRRLSSCGLKVPASYQIVILGYCKNSLCGVSVVRMMMKMKVRDSIVHLMELSFQKESLW